MEIQRRLIPSKALSSWICSKAIILAKNALEAKRESTLGTRRNWLTLWMSHFFQELFNFKSNSHNLDVWQELVKNPCKG